MTESEFFERCKSLVGDESDRAWDRDSMAGFLQCFRNDHSALRNLLADIPRGLSVYSRLVEIFEATSGHTTKGRTNLYCIVREPVATASWELLLQAESLIENFRKMAIAIGESDLVTELSPTPTIRLEYCDPPDVAPSEYSLDAFIYDVQCDWHGNLSRFTDHATWMSEAFYYLNCDYYLARYANWAWYMDDSTIHDPFLPYFKLWRCGAELRCKSRDDVALYIPQGQKRRVETP